MKELLNERFKIKELGHVGWILGIAVERNIRLKTLIMHLEKSINNLVLRFGKENSTCMRLPYSGRADHPSDLTSPTEDMTLYCSLIGSLLYGAVATRPHITKTVSIPCKKMKAPNM